MALEHEINVVWQMIAARRVVVLAPQMMLDRLFAGARPVALLSYSSLSPGDLTRKKKDSDENTE
jgi:hypothetical protein